MCHVRDDLLRHVNTPTLTPSRFNGHHTAAVLALVLNRYGDLNGYTYRIIPPNTVPANVSSISYFIFDLGK
jgi:hypothetical protein